MLGLIFSVSARLLRGRRHPRSGKTSATQKLMKKDGRLKKFYLIYWKGYPNECDHTWEPPENLRAVKDMIY
jgi:hypothetical protein